MHNFKTHINLNITDKSPWAQLSLFKQLSKNTHAHTTPKKEVSDVLIINITWHARIVCTRYGPIIPFAFRVAKYSVMIFVICIHIRFRSPITSSFANIFLTDKNTKYNLRKIKVRQARLWEAAASYVDGYHSYQLVCREP